jgi:hypothetical protein
MLTETGTLYDLVITLKMDGLSKTLRYQLSRDWALERNGNIVKIDLVE